MKGIVVASLSSRPYDNLTHSIHVFFSISLDAPEITHISGSPTLNNGDQVTLNCTADGNPSPDITWTRLSDNNVVAFPLTITGKQDQGAYRCTADNGVGNPVTRDTSIVVHCECFTKNSY